MLENIRGIISVKKLQALLLLEEDFNGINKIIYSTRLIPKLERRQSIAYEIIGGRR